MLSIMPGSVKRVCMAPDMGPLTDGWAKFRIQAYANLFRVCAGGWWVGMVLG